MNNDEQFKPTSKTLVLTDYGGVLADHHCDPAESALASLLSVDRQRARELLSEKSEHGAAFREGRISENDFWGRVIALADTPVGSCPASSVLSALWAETYAVNLDILELLKAVRQKAPIGILTNIDYARSTYLKEKVGILKEVDAYFPSYRFQAIKPAPRLWKAVDTIARERFGDDVRIVYVDDRESHVKASREIGWDSIVYHSLEMLRNDLARRMLISV